MASKIVEEKLQHGMNVFDGKYLQYLNAFYDTKTKEIKCHFIVNDTYPDMKLEFFLAKVGQEIPPSCRYVSTVYTDDECIHIFQKIDKKLIKTVTPIHPS